MKILLLFCILTVFIALPAKAKRRRARPCQEYTCFSKLKSNFAIDQSCRQSQFLSNACYCCGGFREYVTFGQVCRRFCRKEVDSSGNPTLEPCRPLPQVENEDLNPTGASPNYPRLVSVDDIVCRGEENYESAFGADNEQFSAPIAIKSAPVTTTTTTTTTQRPSSTTTTTTSTIVNTVLGSSGFMDLRMSGADLEEVPRSRSDSTKESDGVNFQKSRDDLVQQLAF